MGHMDQSEHQFNGIQFSICIGLYLNNGQWAYPTNTCKLHTTLNYRVETKSECPLDIFKIKTCHVLGRKFTIVSKHLLSKHYFYFLLAFGLAFSFSSTEICMHTSHITLGIAVYHSLNDYRYCCCVIWDACMFVYRAKQIKNLMN